MDELSNVVDFVTNASSSQFEVQFFIFEDIEAVIKMIIEATNPTMRHVSRSHRVALDWLFDRVSLDSKIQIKYVDTKNHFPGMLTKSNCTRDECNHLLRLFNIMNFSMFSCSHFLSIQKPNTMSKTAHERRTREEPVVAKSKSASFDIQKPERNRPPRWIRVRHTARGITVWVGILIPQALFGAGQSRKPKQQVLESGTEMIFRFQAEGNRCGR